MKLRNNLFSFLNSKCGIWMAKVNRSEKDRLMQYRGVSGSLKLGGQVVLWQLWRRAAVAGGAFYSAKKWGGQLPPLPPLY